MNRKLVTLAAAFCMCVSGAMIASAQQKAPAKAPAAQSTAKATEHKTQPTHTTKGTVSSVTTTQLMLSPGKGRKDLSFMLGADAQKPANLAPGDKVTVHYRVENNQNMVTSIQTEPSKNSGITAKKRT